MNKKVLIINGSFRKKNTYNLLLQIGEILGKHQIDVEILNLFDYEIKDCIGCETCIYKSADCVLKDDRSILKQKIMESDGIILGSPVYLRSVTSKFKTLADRLCSWFHKPEPAGKPVLFVTTTASTGIKETKKFLESFAIGMGARLGDFIYRKENKLHEAIKEKELSRFLSLMKKDQEEYRPAMGEIVIFEVQKVLAIRSGKADKAFWEEKEWLDKYYYYKCKIGLGKKLFSKMMFKILSKALKQK